MNTFPLNDRSFTFGAARDSINAPGAVIGVGEVPRDLAPGASAKRRINLIAASQVPAQGREAFPDARNGSYVRAVSAPAGEGAAAAAAAAEPPWPSSPRRRGILSRRTLDGPGDKYPSDIMDGACIRPRHEYTTEQILLSFREVRFSSARARARGSAHVCNIEFEIRIRRN